MEEEMLIKEPQTKRGKKTLNNILNAAIQVFYEKGYHSASINDITSLAGVASGTFYVYFDGKYNLYKYLMLRCSQTIRKHLSKSVEGCKTRREVEEVGLRSWLEFVLKNQYMYHIIWESLYIDRELFNNYYITFCKAYMKGLAPAQESGEIRNIDLEVLSYTLMGASNFLGLRWGLFNQETPTEEVDYVVEEFMKILDAGVFTPKEEKTESAVSQEENEATDKRFRFNISLFDDDEDTSE